MYCSELTHNFQLEPLFQSNPIFGEDDHQSWTESLSSYRSSARHLSGVIELNRRCKGASSYRYAVTISLTEELPANEVRKRWSAICRSLRQSGLAAIWLCEPNTDTNCVHYHLLISVAPVESLSCILQTLRQKHNCRTWFKQLSKRKINAYINYICKASDHHKPQLFKPSTLTKHGVIGPFWNKPKPVLQDYQKHKFYHRTKQGMNEAGSVQLVELLYTWFGGTMSKRQLCQKVGFLSTLRWWSEFPTYDRYRRWRFSLIDSGSNFETESDSLN